MAHDVFISYASADKLQADAICNRLESHGIRCWIAPRDILSGKDYGEAIVEAIEASRIVVLVYSGSAEASKFVKKEIERAVHYGKTISPVRLEEREMGKNFELFTGNVHWLDAITPPLERHYDKLASDLKKSLGMAEATPASAPKPVSLASPLSALPAASSSAAAPAAPASRTMLFASLGVAALVVVGGGGYFAYARASGTVTVPDVLGQNLDAARNMLQGASLAVAGTVEEEENAVRNYPTVVRTSPNPGVKLKRGSEVTLVVSSMATVPEGLTKESEAGARQMLARAGLSAQVQQQTSPAPEGTVLGSSPPANARLPRTKPVTLLVAATKTRMPEVAGQSLADAAPKLTALGLKTTTERVWTSGSDKPGTVLSTEPAGGAALQPDAPPVILRVAAPGGWVYLAGARIDKGQTLKVPRGGFLRERPDSSGKQLGAVDAGQEVRVLEVGSYGWIKVVTTRD